VEQFSYVYLNNSVIACKIRSSRLKCVKFNLTRTFKWLTKEIIVWGKFVNIVIIVNCAHFSYIRCPFWICAAYVLTLWDQFLWFVWAAFFLIFSNIQIFTPPNPNQELEFICKKFLIGIYIVWWNLIFRRNWNFYFLCLLWLKLLGGNKRKEIQFNFLLQTVLTLVSSWGWRNSIFDNWVPPNKLLFIEWK